MTAKKTYIKAGAVVTGLALVAGGLGYARSAYIDYKSEKAKKEWEEHVAARAVKEADAKRSTSVASATMPVSTSTKFLTFIAGSAHLIAEQRRSGALAGADPNR